MAISQDKRAREGCNHTKYKLPLSNTASKTGDDVWGLEDHYSTAVVRTE